jgi:hypothetical protein
MEPDDTERVPPAQQRMPRAPFVVRLVVHEEEHPKAYASLVGLLEATLDAERVQRAVHVRVAVEALRSPRCSSRVWQ